MAEPTPEPCGCRAIELGEGYGHAAEGATIIYCPLHAAAGELLAALKSDVGLAESILGNLAGNGMDSPAAQALVIPALRMLVKERRASIHRATGDEE